MGALLSVLVALLVDRALGEPHAAWHPVVWMGRLLETMGRRVAPVRETVVRHFEPGPWLLGTLAWWAGAVTVLALALGLQCLLTRADAWVAALFTGWLLKPMLAWRCLREEVLAVEHALAHSTALGRVQLSRLVSRDTAMLDATAVRESAIESLAENLNDSVVAPLFWFLVAGLPGAALYRWANTADAMWGYDGLRRDGRGAWRDWTWAGQWAARADDALSWLPARLSASLLILAAGGARWCRLRTEARRTPSPNSGWPMAATALALGLRLRKPGVYALNAGGRAPTAGDTQAAIALAQRALWLGLALLAVGAWGVHGALPWVPR